MELELTMQQLADISLGAPKLCGINTVLLHSLLDLLLQQLNCENEKVCISGYEAMQLIEVLKESSLSPFVFESEKSEEFTCNRESINKLESKIDHVSDKLKQHLANVGHQSNGLKGSLSDCQDFCSPCAPEDKFICDLACNYNALRTIWYNAQSPLENRIVSLENKIELLQSEYSDLKQRIVHLMTNVDKLEMCLSVLEESENRFKIFQAEFMESVVELQQIMDTKVNGCHLLDLRSYLNKYFDEIHSSITDVESQRKCKKAAAVVNRPYVPVVRKETKEPTHCKCGGVFMYMALEQPLSVRMQDLKTDRIKNLLLSRGRSSTSEHRSIANKN